MLQRHVLLRETRVIRVNNVSTMLHHGKIYPYQPAMDPILAIGQAVFVDDKGKEVPEPEVSAAPAEDIGSGMRRKAPLRMRPETPAPQRDAVRNGNFSEG